MSNFTIAKPASGHKINVLLLDDEKDLLNSMQRVLKTQFNVTTESSPLAAYEIIQENPDNFSVIVADLIMNEMTGMDLYQKLKTNYPGLEKRMVFMTGGIFTQTVDDFLKKVSNPLIEKPFKMSELIQAIHKTAEMS